MLIPWDYKKSKLRKGYALLINIPKFLKRSVRERKKIVPFKITNYSHWSPQRQEQQPLTAKTGGQSHSLIYTSPSPVTTVVPSAVCRHRNGTLHHTGWWQGHLSPPSHPLLSMQDIILMKADALLCRMCITPGWEHLQTAQSGGLRLCSYMILFPSTNNITPKSQDFWERRWRSLLKH